MEIKDTKIHDGFKCNVHTSFSDEMKIRAEAMYNPIEYKYEPEQEEKTPKDIWLKNFMSRKIK